MSQIPRRTTLSLTQPPKVRKTPSISPAASQPARRQESDSPRTTLKTIDVDTPIVIEDTDFGDSLANNDLIELLNTAEEKNGCATPAANNGVKSVPVEEQKNGKDATPTNGKPKDSSSSNKRGPKSKKTAVAPETQESTATDETLSSSPSIRSSVDSSTARSESENPVEMDSILIPEDDDLVALSATVSSVKEKSLSSVDSPRPNKTPGGTKVVRLTKGMRLSPFRKASESMQSPPLDNVSTIVNLSTVSEQSVENNLDSPVVQAKPTPEGSAVEDAGEEEGGATETVTGGRRISARRTYATNRPLREMSFRNATREAFRKNGSAEENSSEAAAVNDSVNATVGSELGFNMDDLPETPAGVKRRRDSSDAEDESAPEAKKSLFQTYCSIM